MLRSVPGGIFLHRMRDGGGARGLRVTEVMMTAGHTNQPPSGCLQQSDHRPAIHVYLWVRPRAIAIAARKSPGRFGLARLGQARRLGCLETCLSALGERRYRVLPDPLRIPEGADHQQRHLRPALPVVALGYHEPGTINALPTELSLQPGKFVVSRIALVAECDVAAVGAKRYPAALARTLHDEAIRHIPCSATRQVSIVVHWEPLVVSHDAGCRPDATRAARPKTLTNWTQSATLLKELLECKAEWRLMAKAIFTTKVDPTYDNLPEFRYHFPRTYLRAVEATVGDWIIYYEPRRTSGELSSRGGRQAYFATARVAAVRSDPTMPDHFYAFVEDFLEFPRPVPFKDGDLYYEFALRRIDGRTSKGAFGRAVRPYLTVNMG